MEQSILENSKGATYMSFILDIEIVIKKDDARVNLAETKTKSQVSKKKDGESKEPYSASRNQDVKVYAVSDTPRKSIFEASWGDDKESDVAESNTNRNEKKTMANKENIPDNIHFQAQTDAINTVGRTSISGGEHLVTNNPRPKKKKISKAEKKAKVFKGKVEPIDFLECNRIFMCNYFKIPISRRKRNLDTNNISSDSQVVSNEDNRCKVNSVKAKSLSTPKLDRPTSNTLRLRKFWRKNSSSLVNENSTPDKYSSGDNKAINPTYVNNNEFEINELNSIENNDSEIRRRKNQMKRRHLISEFKYTGRKTNLSLRRNIEIPDNGEDQHLSTGYNKQDRNGTVMKQCKSMPGLKENTNLPTVTCAKSEINQQKHFRTIKKKSVSFINALKSKTHSKPCTADDSFIGLQFNAFNDVEFVLAPELYTKNGDAQISNCSVDNIYILKEENLPDMEKHSHADLEELGRISHETENKIQEKSCIETGSEPKSSSELVLEDKVSSNTTNIFDLENNDIEENDDKLTSVNIVYMENDVLPDLQSSPDSKPSTCVIMPQINISNPELEENYLTGNECQLEGKSYDTHSESEELNTTICDDKDFKTTPICSSKNTLNEVCDVDVSQISTENQTTDKTEKLVKEDGKSKTSTLKTLHSYFKSVTTKFRK